MDAQYLQEAGPEWAYCATLVQTCGTKQVDLNSMFIRAWDQSQPDKAEYDLIELLADDNARSTSPVIRYKFDNLRQQYLGQDSDHLRVFFQAFRDAPYVEISDNPSFRRLLMAIQVIGLPIPEGLQPPIENLYPPVLRFIYGPQNFDPNTAHPVKQPVRPEDNIQQRPTPIPATPVPALPDHNDDVLPGFGDEDNSSEDEIDSNREIGDGSLFLEPKGPGEETALEHRVQQLYNFGLGSNRGGLHNRNWHNLYADIAGISRQRCDSDNGEHHYQPPYSQISLPPYQTYPVGWLLGDRRRILHYLADSPGLGKTFSAIEAMVRVTMILSLRVQIQEELDALDRSRARPRHIHNQDHYIHGRNRECRADTQRLYGVVCPCTTDSPTAQLVNGNSRLGQGYMLVLVPSGLTDQWVREINNFLKPGAVLPHNSRPIEIVDISSNATRKGAALQNFIYDRRAHAGLGTICVAGTSIVRQSVHQLALAPRGSLTQQPSLIVLDEAHNDKGVDTMTPRLILALINVAPEPVHVLAISGGPVTEDQPMFTAMESIATSESLERFYTGTRNQYMHQLENVREPLLNSARQISRSRAIQKCGLGLNLSEEDKTHASTLIRQYDDAGRNYANVLPLLQRRPLDDYFGYPIPRVAPQSDPPQTMREDTVMSANQRVLGDIFRQWLQRCLAARVTRWRGEPMGTRGPEPTMAGNLFMLETDRQVNPLNGILDRSRVHMSLAMFAPDMALDMINIADNPGWFRAEEANKVFAGTQFNTQRQAVMRSGDYDGVWQSTHVYRHGRITDEISSSKIRSIVTTIDEMLLDQDLHAGRNPNLGPLRKKALICVPYPWHAYLLMAFLFRQYPGRNFTYIGSCFSQAERNMLLEPFNRQTIIDDPREQDPDDPIALISTYQYVAEGHNLTRCNYAIATSPLSSRTYELQLFARVYRRGQGCVTHTRILMDDGDPSDVILFHRRLGRTPDTVPQAERGFGYQFLLQTGAYADDPMVIDD